jgi:hypothetical protein
VIAVRRGYALKRALDVALVAGTLPLWLPLLLAVAVLVRVRLGAPVLFRQQRPGRGGVPFELLKFRTMSDARDASGAPLADEARLTRFGRRLRSTSLDELPELLNVLRGDMSLVGPRPLLLRYMPRYSPGTCAATSCGRGSPGSRRSPGATRSTGRRASTSTSSTWTAARSAWTCGSRADRAHGAAPRRGERGGRGDDARVHRLSGDLVAVTPASSRRSAQERQGPTDAGASSAVRTRAHTRA